MEPEKNLNEEQVNQESAPEFTYDELLAMLDQERAEKARYKAAVTKTSSEAAEWKKKFRARQTAEEQEADAKREETERLREQNQQIEHELATMRATARYLKQGMDEKLAKECADLETAGDSDALMSKLSAHWDSRIEKAVKKAQEDLLASRPDINAGNGEDGGNQEDPFIKAFRNPDQY